MILLTCDQKLTKSQFSPTHASTKKITEELKQNAESYGVREGSPVEVQWAVRWVGEDLWCEGFVEQVSFKSGMEEKGSYGWCDGGDRWWMRLKEWGRKIIPKTGWCITERAICDFESKMRVDEWWWWEMMNECDREAEQRSGYADKQVKR